MGFCREYGTVHNHDADNTPWCMCTTWCFLVHDHGVCGLLGVPWCTTVHSHGVHGLLGVPWCTTVHKHGVQYQTMSLLLHPDTRLQAWCSIFFCMLSCLIGANFIALCLKNSQHYLCQPWYIWFLRCWNFCWILWLVEFGRGCDINLFKVMQDLF